MQKHQTYPDYIAIGLLISIVVASIAVLSIIVIKYNTFNLGGRNE